VVPTSGHAYAVERFGRTKRSFIFAKAAVGRRATL
jgi:hypothetical protein